MAKQDQGAREARREKQQQAQALKQAQKEQRRQAQMDAQAMKARQKQQRAQMARGPMSQKTAVSILVIALAPLLFILVLLIGFKAWWGIPFLAVAAAIALGLAKRLSPEFFEALRHKKEEEIPIEKELDLKPATPSRRSYMMLVNLSHGIGQQITVNASPFVIGRASDSDFCISDSYVSSRHLVIEFNPEENICYATDYSSNGSYLNSVRMPNEVKRPLHQGDTLQIAGMLFRVEYVHF